MITGFNPADMYAADHIRRVLKTFPGVFTGIGEFTHPQGVRLVEDRRRNRQPDQPGARPHPRVRRRIGLVVILHSDIDMPFAEDGRRAGLSDADEGAARAPPEDHRSSGPTPASDASSIPCRCPPPPRSAPGHLGSWNRCSAIRRSRTSTSTSRGTRSRSTRSRRPRPTRASPRCSTVSRPFPLRHRHGGACRSRAVLRGVRHVGAGVSSADARGQPQGAQGQLPADLRRGPSAGPCLGEGQWLITTNGEKTNAAS